MKQINRREFLTVSAAAGIGLMAADRLVAAPFKTTLRKSMYIGDPKEETFKALKDAGFEGVEVRVGKATPEEAKVTREQAEKIGIRIQSMMGGAGNPNGLRVAAAYGADAVLHCPGGVGKVPMPEPWEFDIEFDETNGHITRVVKGDNEKFKTYIETHNRSMDSSREHITKLIPVAEETKVVIALENVWNNFCVKPSIFKWLVASFKSPWVKAYFDVGNHVKYITPPEVWIREYGSLLGKVHIKDFKLNPDNHGGKFVHPRDGSVNWPAVRQAFDDVGYNGWLTIEDGGLSYPEFSKRLDQIIAGQ
ncbi:MAG: sugar phosphate isomerase/epimerase [Kiritimatiellae bacterium]|nr:sugar phosphate isomerase/epimerase [Kiritimatiellia bacterium]MDD5521734.1 sugar phosphate isomerase/epimerase [Kiritimatiellia bacterium]